MSLFNWFGGSKSRQKGQWEAGHGPKVWAIKAGYVFWADAQGQLMTAHEDEAMRFTKATAEAIANHYNANRRLFAPKAEVVEVAPLPSGPRIFNPEDPEDDGSLRRNGAERLWFAAGREIRERLEDASDQAAYKEFRRISRGRKKRRPRR
jgi:hypothetical protein